MNEISPIGIHHAVMQRLSEARTPEVQPQRVDLAETDRVELSQSAQMLAELAALPEIRTDLVAQIQSQIEAGTYDTDAKFNAAVDRLIEDFAAIEGS